MTICRRVQRCRFYRRVYQRQRRKTKVNASYATKTTMPRERVVKGRKFVTGTARADF